MANSRPERRSYRFTMPVELDDALTALSQATGISKTTWLIRIIQEAVPGIQTLTLAAQGLKSEELFHELQDRLLQAQCQVSQASLDLNNQIKIIRSGRGRPRGKAPK